MTGRDTILRFGRHAGKRLREIPGDYLSWLYGELAAGQGHEDNSVLLAAINEELEARREARV